MKGFLFDVFGTVATVVGAVVGAGFISGAEIARFFLGSHHLVCCVILFVLFAFFSFVLLDAGRQYGNQKDANLHVLGRFSVVGSGASYVFCFITLSGMCAGLDAVVASAFGISSFIPTLSLPFILLSLWLCKRGTGWVKAFNLALVPVMVAVIIPACILGGSVAVVPTRQGGASALVYTGLNCLLASGVMIDGGKKLSRRQCALVAIIASLVISTLAFMIMRKISSGYGTGENLPLISSLKSSRAFYVLFMAITVLGIVTTLVSSHYPLVVAVSKSPLKHTLNVCLCIGALALSRIGFYKIVDVLYPFIGMFGVVYCTAYGYNFAKISLSSFKGKPLYKRNHGVHTRCECAQDKCGCEH